NELIRTVLSIVRIDLQKNGVELQLQLSERLPTALGDEVQLQQVVLNLITNAVEAMRSVHIRVLTVSTAQRDPGMVGVSVEDTGPGIDPKNVDQIFNPLFTTKASGTGMGLAICRSIIERHGGRIWAAAGSGGGSILRFELPISGAH